MIFGQLPRTKMGPMGPGYMYYFGQVFGRGKKRRKKNKRKDASFDTVVSELRRTVSSACMCKSQEESMQGTWKANSGGANARNLGVEVGPVSFDEVVERRLPFAPLYTS